MLAAGGCALLAACSPPASSEPSAEAATPPVSESTQTSVLRKRAIYVIAPNTGDKQDVYMGDTFELAAAYKEYFGWTGVELPPADQTPDGLEYGIYFREPGPGINGHLYVGFLRPDGAFRVGRMMTVHEGREPEDRYEEEVGAYLAPFLTASRRRLK